MRPSAAIVHPNDDPGMRPIKAQRLGALFRGRDVGRRLLNTTDGVLGQSTKAMVLLTTNEELTRLHPALARPGRCLARTEFLKFSQHEARTWLGDGGSSPSGGTTLAELFEARRTGRPVEATSALTGSCL
jgi:hypothetical protein